MNIRALALVTLLALLGLATPAFAQEPAKHAPVYDEQADAAAELAAAKMRAAAENRRVLVVWGANWCHWCVKLHGLCESDAGVAKKLLYEYDVVRVDVGRFDKNMELAQSLGADFTQTGIPYLTILDGAGKVLANQETGALELGEAHDPAKVIAFLAQHQAPYEKAAEVRDRVLKSAAAAGKKLLVTFDAPWCIWCKRFEAWLAKPEVAALMAKHFVIQKIDVERTLGGQELCDGYGGKQLGIPWFAFLDGAGKTLGTSTIGGKNLGCPYEVEEIAAFGTLLRQVAPQLTAEDWSALERSLTANRAALEQQKHR
ncbi:MAG: DUF255 domain-containing protein [Planctomycetes bacterium]|nr:DUF255 domain-containing protein [Planctomycetota bacterium]